MSLLFPHTYKGQKQATLPFPLEVPHADMLLGRGSSAWSSLQQTQGPTAACKALAPSPQRLVCFPTSAAAVCFQDWEYRNRQSALTTP